MYVPWIHLQILSENNDFAVTPRDNIAVMNNLKCSRALFGIISAIVLVPPYLSNLLTFWLDANIAAMSSNRKQIRWKILSPFVSNRKLW